MKNNPQKYATLKFKSLSSAEKFKVKVCSEFLIKIDGKGMYSVRFKINKSIPLSENYHKNRLKYD